MCYAAWSVDCGWFLLFTLKHAAVHAPDVSLVWAVLKEYYVPLIHPCNIVLYHFCSLYEVKEGLSNPYESECGPRENSPYFNWRCPVTWLKKHFNKKILHQQQLCVRDSSFALLSGNESNKQSPVPTWNCGSEHHCIFHYLVLCFE